MTTSKQVIISAKNLHRGYTIGKKRVEVLRGVNLEIYEGEKVFLCGPSGAGKTTLMYTLAGLESPEKGSVTLDGTDIFSLSRTAQAKLRNQKIAYIFQNYYLLPELTAIENVSIPSLIGKRFNKKDAEVALERVGLKGRLDHLPAELSGGEQQRVAIARAIMGNPKIIFADEPTGNLDSINGKTVMDLLIRIADEDNATLVIVTHDNSLASIGDRVLTVSDGNVVSRT